jgi:hypothetical protein
MGEEKRKGRERGRGGRGGDGGQSPHPSPHTSSLIPTPYLNVTIPPRFRFVIILDLSKALMLTLDTGHLTKERPHSQISLTQRAHFIQQADAVMHSWLCSRYYNQLQSMTINYIYIYIYIHI